MFRERGPAGPHLGFKLVACKNALEVDPVVAMLATRDSSTGEVWPQRPEDWITLLIAVGFHGRVPHEVQRMFVFAQGLCATVTGTIQR